MTREQMIVYMDLLDETFIEEASPENSKYWKRKQFHTAMIRYGATAACLLLLIGGIIIMRYLSRTEDLFIAQIKAIPAEDAPLYASFESLDEMIETTHANLIIRCTVSNRGDSVVFDPWGIYKEDDLTADATASAAAQKCLSTPYTLTVNDCYLGTLAIDEEITYYAPYGILDTYAYRRAGVPIFEIGEECILILRAEEINDEIVYYLSYTPDSVYFIDSTSEEIVKETSLFYPYRNDVSALETHIRTLISEKISLHSGNTDKLSDSMGFGEQQNTNSIPQDTDSIIEPVSPEPSNEENADSSIHHLFVLNEVTDVLSAAPKYRDPEQHYKETWDVDTMAEYLGIDLYSILEAFSQKHGMMMFNIGKKQFGVTFENSGQIVEDTSTYQIINNPDKDHSGFFVTASKLRPPYDCMYQTETEIMTTVPIGDSGEALELMICVYRDAVSPENPPKYIADFHYNDVFYRIEAIDISIEQLAELIAQIIRP